MASSQKTETLQLNQWIATDKPKREDYNTDNANIEAFSVTMNNSMQDLIDEVHTFIDASGGNISSNNVSYANVAMGEVTTAKGALDLLMTIASALTSGKEDKKTQVTVTLSSTNWAGTTSPYTQAVTVTGMTSNADGDYDIANTANATQVQSFASGVIWVSSQGANTVTFSAAGEKPESNIPIVIRW